MSVEQQVAGATAHPLVLALGREARGVAEAWRIPAARQGTAGLALVLAGSFTPAFLPPTNPFQGVPFFDVLQTGPGAVAATVVLMLGVLLLLDAWLRLRPRPGSMSAGPSRHILWLWSAPLLLAPPLFSRDAYSYAAQGALLHVGQNPYDAGPVFGPVQFSDNVDPLWLFTPAPYGPLSMQIQHLVVDVVGMSHPYVAAVAMRIPALVGVALIAVLLPRIAERLGYDGPTTVWLAVLNPLVVIHLVGGAHNDALMIGLMVLAVYLAMKTEPWALYAAIGATAAAGAIKAWGLLALLVVAAIEARRRHRGAPTIAEVMRVLVPITGLCVVMFALITAVTGLGYGWVSALGVPGSIRSILSPPTALGIVSEQLSIWMGIPGAENHVVPVVQAIGLVAGLVVAARVAIRLGPVAPVRALAYVGTIIVLTGPVVHPWYVLWAGLLLAMTDGTRRVTSNAIVWVTAGLVVYGTVDAAFRNGALALGVTAALALGWIALGHDRQLDRERDRLRMVGLDELDRVGPVSERVG